jgi:hypothetical protein
MRFVSSMSGVFTAREPAKSGESAKAVEAAINSFRVVIALIFMASYQYNISVTYRRFALRIGLCLKSDASFTPAIDMASVHKFAINPQLAIIPSARKVDMKPTTGIIGNIHKARHTAEHFANSDVPTPLRRRRFGIARYDKPRQPPDITQIASFCL